MHNEAVPFFLFLALMVAILFGMHKLADVPVIEVDAATHECVRVVPDKAGSCDQLPEMYEVVFVAPRWMEADPHQK